MKLYLLRPIDDWVPWFDKSFGHVVRAECEFDARNIASRECGDEGTKVWMDDKKTSCEELSSDGEAGHILRDFASA